MQSAEYWFQSLIATAGIQLNGSAPYDIQVHNPAMFHRIRWQGTLGLGDSYINGWWDCANLDDLFYRLFTAHLDRTAGLFIPQLLGTLRAYLANLQSVSRAFQVGERHYDLDNQLFRSMLGDTMVYSCAYSGSCTRMLDRTLDEAQLAKLDLICRKLHLSPGTTVLEIGCGWGAFARFAAEHYGVHVIGLTVSENQATFARNLCAGLPVDIRLQDYRSFTGHTDTIVSVGMFEHVGVKNYPAFFNTARRALSPNGIFLLHTIGSLHTELAGEPWINTHIFPNGKLPSLRQITTAIEGRFLIEDLQNIGPDYDFTLMSWSKNFQRSIQRGELLSHLDQRFQRMWQYYLLTCAAAFRSRCLQLWQLVLSPNGVPGGYQSAR